MLHIFDTFILPHIDECVYFTNKLSIRYEYLHILNSREEGFTQQHQQKRSSSLSVCVCVFFLFDLLLLLILLPSKSQNVSVHWK